MQKTGASAKLDSLSGRLVYFAALCGPLSCVPQIVEIWLVDKSAAGVSLLTWSAFFVMSVIWLLYGISRKDRPLILSNALWLLAEAVIIAGAIHYDIDFL